MAVGYEALDSILLSYTDLLRIWMRRAMLSVAWLVVTVALVTAFVSTLLIPGYVYSPRKPSGAKKSTFDCGEDPAPGEAWSSFKFQYYPLIVIFAVFDAAAIFLFLWATSNFSAITAIVGLAFVGTLLVTMPVIIVTIERVYGVVSARDGT